MQSSLPIALLLVELKGQRGDGFELLRFIKSNLRFNHIPVIICSESADSETVVHGIGLGAKDYIVKPIDEEKLMARVQRILGIGRGTVFIAGIDDITVNILKRSIELEGYQVFTAKSGKAVLTALKSNSVDIVIAEVYLDDMTGLDLLVEIKEKESSVPVILVANQNAALKEEELIAAGADDGIRKPFNDTAIIAKITILCRTKRRKLAGNIKVARKIMQLKVGPKKRSNILQFKGDTL